MVSQSTATLQVVINPMLRRGSPIYEGSFRALQNLRADYVRYAAWYPYPKLSVAQLRRPDKKSSYWDFSLIDPMTLDFFKATEGHPSVLNFCTIPQWMFKTDEPVAYPDDPNEIAFNYTGGNKLVDSTMKELGDYYARLVSWYSKGGFTDELGKYHHSGHNFEIPYWEVLNEPELEHYTTPEEYTERYDAIVSSIRQISPSTKFIGMGAVTYWNPRFFEYFLDSTNHKPGIPIDMISYHFYASPLEQFSFDDYQYIYFEKTDQFVNFARYIESIKNRLSPGTRSAINELGTFVSATKRNEPIPAKYWNLSGSVFAYMYIELTKLGIDIIGASQLVGYPGQYPDVSMMNWENGKPNARYWVLKLINDHLLPGDSLVETTVGFMTETDYAAQAFKTKDGKRKVLILNKRDQTLSIEVPANFVGGQMNIVDITTGEQEAKVQNVSGPRIEATPFAVMVVTLPD